MDTNNTIPDALSVQDTSLPDAAYQEPDEQQDEELVESVKHQDEELSESIEQQDEELVESVKHQDEELSESIEHQGEELSESIQHQDEELFESIEQSKKKKRRKIIITVVSIILALATAAVISVSVLQRRVRERFASSSGDVLAYEVETGSINSAVSGSGRLTDVDLEAVTVPEGVEITEVTVKSNQAVAEGDVLATVEMSSVVSTMAELQAEMKELDEQISDAEDDAADTNVKAGVSGRLKAIFCTAGADVADVMYENGALAVISLDGFMAVTVETDALAVGDSVTVRLSDGSEQNGTVETVVGGKATILIADDTAAYLDTVTVLAGDGTELGSGELELHSPYLVTGYAGTISAVKKSVNDSVTSSSKLFKLADTGYSANYNSLLRERSELEDTLLELLTIQHDGAILAKTNGSVYSIDYSDEDTSAVVTLSTDEKVSVTISVDESDILSLEVGQKVSVTVSSVSEDAFEGTLTEIDRSVTDSGTYSAVVELDKTDGMLSGMTASVSVRIEGVDDALLIPVEALHKTSSGAYVYTSYDEELDEYGGRTDVVTGLENSTYIEIKSGLKAGDTVYYVEEQSGFGNFGGGERPSDFGGGSERTDFSGSGRPDFGGSGRPDAGGGNRPDAGGRPGF